MGLTGPGPADRERTPLEERLREVMAAPLARIVAPDRRVRPPGTVVDRWKVPEEDRSALAEWGLPTDLVMRPEFQHATEPLLVPNVAGEHERRLIADDQRLYHLGWWGAHDRTPKMGAVAGDGRVLAVRDAPVTAADVHPDLRRVYTDLYQPAVAFLNSSIARLVELAWRWRSAVAILREFHLQEPHYSRPEEEHDAHLARVEAGERIVLARAAEIDPAIDPDDPRALWVALITDPGC
ncbi:SUKH-4 family immunity protein [Actinoallomurus sp. CA-142502]|uniref:SUKH-4 family immunity protein n=1 Tax=Actinoallomurus sp. CA-142502 TaxID=3239885 RepID=UPI003D9044CE